MIHIARLSLATLFIAVFLPAHAQEPDDIAGQIVAQVDGQTLYLPMLTTDLDVDVQGDMATVRLTQTFVNPSDKPMSAEYLFPLNQHAAVHAMEMRVGDEVVKAVIQKKQEAIETFEQAEKEGKAAALLTQHRPNMFTQNIANLMPGLPITVTLSYVQSVPRIEGAYELVIPLIVGPRYEGAPEVMDDMPEEEPTLVSGWSVSPLPAYPDVTGLTLPDEIDADRVSLDLNITAPVPVAAITSATHALSVDETSETTQSATLAAGRVIDNRDLVLRYALAGDETQAGILTHYDDNGGYVSVMIEPPAIPDEAGVLARELVFVLDTSGSMGGLPIKASKRFMDAALTALRPDDYFRIIRFSNSADHFSTDAQSASPQNIRRGKRFVRGLDAGGGTEINTAINAAFATRQPANTLRIVVFLSDGYIGGEAQVLRTIRKQIGDARIYAFGVGTSVNRYLLDAMAEEGRGYTRYVDPTDDAYEAAEALARDLKTPLLTDIEIDWGDADVTDVRPARLPDLFDGNALRVFARYTQGGPATVTIKGNLRGRFAELPVNVNLPAQDVDNDTKALPLVWARTKIRDHARALAVGAATPEMAERAITDLGLRYNLQTDYTSFVAVSQKVYNDSGVTEKTQVPLPMVAGVPATAYPNGGFSGSSTPEPQTWLGLIVLAALSAARFLRRRRVA